MWIFLYPMFLWAGAAAAIPLILHLVKRRRVVRMPFGTLRFVKAAHARSASRFRMENLLLWLLRTMVIAALVAAFAMPVLRGRAVARLTGSAHRDVAIVLDVSYSMLYETGAGCVWDATRQAALSILQGLQKGDRVCVFLSGDSTTALIERPTGDLDAAAALIRDVEPRLGSSHLDEAAVAAAGALKAGGQGERELYLLSDGQAVPWLGFSTGRAASTNAPDERGERSLSLRDPRMTSFVLLEGPAAPENAWPLDVRIAPDLILSNTAATVSARIGHTGPGGAQSVALIVDGSEIARRSIPVEADSDAGVSFAIPELPAGVHPARIAVAGDLLPPDDEFHFLIRVRNQLPVLCVGSEQDAFFLMTALAPGRSRAASIRRVTSDQIAGADLTGYSCVFLANAMPLPGQAVVALEDYVRQGGVLAVFPGDRATPADYEQWSVLPARPPGVVEIPRGNRSFPLRLLRATDPLFSDFALPPGVTPMLALYRRLNWGPIGSGSEVVVAAGDDIPFLVSRREGRGRVLMSAVSADRRWSSLPLTSFFVPLVHQIIRYGAGLERTPPFLSTAPTLNVSEAIAGFKEGDRLETPSGLPVRVRPVRQGVAIQLQADGMGEPGVYHAAGAKGFRSAVLALNLPRTESNLTPVDPGSLAERTGLKNLHVARNAEGLRRGIEEARRGRPLTETFLWIALGLAMVECVLSNRLSRGRGRAKTHVEVDPSGRIIGTGN